MSDPIMYAFTAVYPIIGYVIGRQHWHGAEREYAAWIKRVKRPPRR